MRRAAVSSCITATCKKLGWKPRVKFRELVTEMVREDYKLAERDELVKRHGHKVLDRNE